MKEEKDVLGELWDLYHRAKVRGHLSLAFKILAEIHLVQESQKST